MVLAAAADPAPTIKSVSPITTQIRATFIVTGSGFGDNPPKTIRFRNSSDTSIDTRSCGTTSPSIAISDHGGGEDDWEAGHATCTNNDTIGIFLQSWSDSQIIINGFGTALGINHLANFNIAIGDPITIAIFGPNNLAEVDFHTNVTFPSLPYQTLAFDNFTHDSNLNRGLWGINEAAGNRSSTYWSSPRNAIIAPTLSFSKSNGLELSGVNGESQAATIVSNYSFTPPFTAYAIVKETIAHGSAFVFAISTKDGSVGLSIQGNLNSGNETNRGISYTVSAGPNTTWVSRGILVSAPQLDVWYNISLGVNATGFAVAIVSSQGQILGTSELQIGQRSFYFILAQSEGKQSPVGPNDAYWRWITIDSGFINPLVVAPNQLAEILNASIIIAAFGIIVLGLIRYRTRKTRSEKEKAESYLRKIRRI